MTRKLVVPSNELNLEVLPLPEPRPPSFTGLVGAYSIETAAAPTEVNVGDPITLTIRIRGPEPLENIPAPALHTQQSLVEDFKVSAAPAAAGRAGRQCRVYADRSRPQRPGGTQSRRST